MTTCWDKDPRNRPSMQHVVEEMTVLLQLFPGAELPFEYEDVDDVEVREHIIQISRNSLFKPDLIL